MYELYSLQIELPSGHLMLICGIYHPPKPGYSEDGLIEYIIDIVNDFLEYHPSELL